MPRSRCGLGHPGSDVLRAYASPERARCAGCGGNAKLGERGGRGSPRSAHGRRGGVDVDSGGDSGKDGEGAEARGVLLCLCVGDQIGSSRGRMQSTFLCTPWAGLQG